MWHKPCRTFHPWCPCIKTRCLFIPWRKFPHGSVCRAVMHSTQQLCTQNHLAPQSQTNPGLVKFVLTHRGIMTNIWVSSRSDNGLSPVRCKPLFDQCWWGFFGNRTIGNKFQSSLDQSTTIFIQENWFENENVVCKMAASRVPGD